MRLTLVISSLSVGGAEKVLATMANYWADRGDDITLVTVAGAEADFYELRPQVRRIPLGLTGASRNGFDAIVKNLHRIRQLRAAITQSNAQAVISFVEKTNVITLLATRGLDVGVIVSERTVPSQHDIGFAWSTLRRATYPNADAVVVQSQAVREWFRSFVTSNKLHVIPNPIIPVDVRGNMADLNGLVPQKRGTRLVAAMGRLGREKGFDLLLHAFSDVADAHPEWDLVVFGDGSERRVLEQIAKTLGISGRVFFPGVVADSRNFLKRADLFVLASRFEGFPNVLLEAMSCGLPVISFDCPSGPREIIRNEVDGLLISAEDVGALARAMNRLMANEEERGRLARTASQVIERFGVSRVMEIWDEVIRNLSKS